MDVEKTIESILQSQARLQPMFDSHVERANVRAEQADARAVQADKEAAQAREQMAEIRQILRQTAFVQEEQGRILVRIAKNVEELSQAQKNLAAAQERTEASLNAFIESLRRGSNRSDSGKQ